MTVCVRYASRSLDRYAGVELETVQYSVLNDVIDNFQVRLKHIYRENGWHIEHILS